MNIRRIVPIVGTLLVLCGCSTIRRSATPPSPSSAQADRKPGGRAVSLKVLQQKLKDGASGPDRDDLLSLCGLRRIDAIIADTKNDDIVLVGTTQGPCPLHTQDLVVALRCSFHLYAQQRGSTLVITAPAVSIDPDPRVMMALDRVMAESTPGQPGRLEAYQQIARSPQAVRVLGMPDCRAAAVAIDCDYFLKRLTNGSVPPPIPGFESLFDLRAQPEREHPFSATRTASQNMDRFWFTGGKARFVEDTGVAVLSRSAPVRLLTEAEFLAGGRIGGTGHPDKLAEVWVSRFTSRFDEIAAHDLRYAELASLFRTFAVANILHARAEEFGTERVLAYLLNDFSVPPANVPRQLPGLSRVEEARPERVTATGKEIAYWCHTSCGGVDLSTPLKPENDQTGQAHVLADRVCSARPTPFTLIWPVVLMFP